MWHWSESLRHKLAKGFALDIPAGSGSEEPGARRQNARWAIESNGLANTTRTKFSLRAVERELTRTPQFEGLTGAKPFRISEGYPRVFATEKGGRRPILAGSG